MKMKYSQKDEINVKNLFECSRKVEELRKLKGFNCYKLLTGYRQSFFNYKDNFISLNRQLTFYYKNQLELFSRDIKRWHIQRKVIGKFHNVISSAQFFIDYLKKDKRKIFFEKELLNEIEIVFEKSELGAFILVLRNFITHIQRLPIISRYEPKKNNGIINILQYESIDKSKIIEYLESENKKNYTLANSFMINSPQVMNLNEIISEYDRVLSEFYEWFVSKFMFYNKSHFIELIKKNNEFQDFACSIGLKTDNPLNKTQVRYINYLIEKFQ